MKYLNKFNQMNESKNVGVIYHYTSLKNLYRILKDNMMISSIDLNHITMDMKTVKNHDKFISFTRNKNLHKKIFEIGEKEKAVRIMFDGTKLSTKYKIIPIDEFYDSYDIDGEYYESEERLILKSTKGGREVVKNISDYIIGIDLNREYLENYGIDPGSIRKFLEKDGIKFNFNYIVDRYNKLKESSDVNEYLEFLKPNILRLIGKDIPVNLF